jgi:hypothetical protein
MGGFSPPEERRAQPKEEDTCISLRFAESLRGGASELRRRTPSVDQFVLSIEVHTQHLAHLLG